MKHLHTLIVFLLTTSLYAQTTEIVLDHANINGFGIAIHGNNLYFSGSEQISKIDLTQTNPTVVEVLTGTGFRSLQFLGNELYYIHNDGQLISKIDVTTQSPTVVDVVTSGIVDSYDMVFKGNELYVSDFNNDRGDDAKIVKIDVTAGTTIPTNVIANLNLTDGMAFHGDGNDLYFVEGGAKILKIDVSQTSPTVIEVITDLQVPFDLAFDENDLYISEFGADKVSKIDVTDNSPSSSDVVSVTAPDRMIIEGAYLYIASGNNGNNNDMGRITRYTDSTLDLGGIDAQTPTLYPNPAKEELYFLGIDAPHPFRIYNLLGTEIAKGSVSKNLPIDIRALTKGLYFVRLENGQTLKFVKN